MEVCDHYREHLKTVETKKIRYTITVDMLVTADEYDDLIDDEVDTFEDEGDLYLRLKNWCSEDDIELHSSSIEAAE